jgi:16S rRNA (guanine966-N2)-methyltransferase
MKSAAPKRDKNAKPARPTKPARLKNEVRIIGGTWRRTRLPVADRPGLRPTPDRVRETLFNWLASLAGGTGGELPGWRCFDVFAGTGALGFEAASRGAAEVTMCETDAALVAQMLATKTKLSAAAVHVTRGSGVSALERATARSLQVVFIDPPFTEVALYGPALSAAARAVQADGVVYLEAPTHWTEAELAPLGLVEFRHLRAGAVHAHLLQLVQPAPA